MYLFIFNSHIFPAQVKYSETIYDASTYTAYLPKPHLLVNSLKGLPWQLLFSKYKILMYDGGKFVFIRNTKSNVFMVWIKG